MFSQHSIIKKRVLGFSLVEVLVTSAIIGIVTAIVVIRYAGFNSAVLMRNQAYEVALSIREAQVFSISVRGDNNTTFRESFGIYVDIGAGGNSPTQQYILFVDDGDGDYENGEEVQIFTLDSRFEIYDICFLDEGSSTESCNYQNISISFQRPNFDAIFSRFPPAVGQPDQIVRLKLRGVNGGPIERIVEVRQTGLISVQ